MLHTTPEALRERQPLLNESGELCLALDGRVDNREELMAGLQANGARLRDDTDAEIVLKTYEAWGEECPARILGDFAFVVWDRSRRQLFCARDPVGAKPLYYSLVGHTFLFASELQPLFQDPRVIMQPNEGMIYEYLCAAITDPEETLFRQIYRLRPACCLTVTTTGLRKISYWNPDSRPRLRYRNDGEYAAHFMDVFRTAVRCRMRAYGRVGAYLSGGVDSSSITAVAQNLVRNGQVSASELETFSLLFPGLPCDESSHINAVLQHCGPLSNFAFTGKLNAEELNEQVHRYQDVGDYPNGASLNSLREIALAKGIRILMTGYGGDEWFSGTPYYYAELIRGLKFRELRDRLCYEGDGHLLVSGTMSKIAHHGLWPLLPLFARRGIKWMRRRYSLTSQAKTASDWIPQQFAARIHAIDRFGHLTTPVRPGSIAYLNSILTNGGRLHGMELEDRSASWCHLEQRHPFHDRRMIEFAYALPEHQLCRGPGKFVLRKAMVGVLPEIVRLRPDKAEFSHLLVHALRSLGGAQLFKSCNIYKIGWLDAQRVQRMYNDMERLYGLDDMSYTLLAWPLWMIQSIERWFTRVFLNSHRTSVITPASLATSWIEEVGL